MAALTKTVNENEAHKDIQYIKHIFYHKRVEQSTESNVDSEKKTLEFTRHLGHKIDIPGSGQWKMITNENKLHFKCWICDR